MTNLEAAARTAPTAAAAGDSLLADLIARPTPPAAHSAPLPRAAAGYRILRAWQRALDVAASAHRLAAALPDADQPTLGADLRRAGWSVPAGIAAGNLAYDPAEHRRALLTAQTALARVETLALLAERLALLPPTSVAALLAESADTLRLVRGLARVAGATAAPPSGTAPANSARTGVRTVVSEPRAPAPRLATTPARATRARRAGPRADAPPTPNGRA